MNKLKLNTILSAAALSLALGATAGFAQDTMNNSAQTMQTANTRNIASGQKAKIRGVVVDRQADMITIKDQTGSNVQVKISGETSIKSKKFFGSGKTYVSDLLTRGLYLEAEGRGDGTALVANKIRFDEDDLRVAQSLDARVTPVEGRVSAAEQNAERLSGQLDELVQISNAARGGAAAAQDTADAAVAGVNATNQRITELDDFAVQSNATVNFKVGSAKLTEEGKANLDTIAGSVGSMKGYVMEITGYADSQGNTVKNKKLSQDRAQAVIDYLVENHGVPLRRILPSYGFGELNAVAENNTREGRAQNRRVEVKLLVSKGLANSVEVKQSATETPQENNEQEQ